ncbi:MAG: hypothetical protein ACLPKI_28405 [Streptosporangiaceae bacterium]
MTVLARAAVAIAAGLGVLLAAGCAASRAPAPRGSVQACLEFGARAIEEHRTVTRMPPACQGLSRGEINFALGRAIFLVAGSGHRKVVWRRDAAIEGARLTRLITSLAHSSPAPQPGVAAASRPAPVDRRPLGLATLAAWLLTVASGGYMLGRFAAGGGLRRPRAAGDSTGPAVVLSHAGLASTGLLVWAAYLASSWLALAWLAVGLLLPVVGFGMATLITWTAGSSRPSPAAPGAGPAAAAAATGPGQPAAGPVLLAAPRPQAPPGQAQAGPGQRPSRWLTVVVPIGHGLFAMATILLALLTALGAG